MPKNWRNESNKNIEEKNNELKRSEIFTRGN